MRHKSSQSYSEKLRDPRWQKLRLQVFERDKFACQSCGSPDNELQVHHKEYANGCEPWESDLESLVTLCSECHETLTLFKRKIGKLMHDRNYITALMVTHEMMTGEMASDFYEIIVSLSCRQPQEMRFAASIMEGITEWTAYSWIKGKNFREQEQIKNHDHPKSDTGTAP